MSVMDGILKERPHICRLLMALSIALKVTGTKLAVSESLIVVEEYTESVNINAYADISKNILTLFELTVVNKPVNMTVLGTYSVSMEKPFIYNLNV